MDQARSRDKTRPDKKAPDKARPNEKAPDEARAADVARGADVAALVKETRSYLCIDCSKCTGSCPIGKAGSTYSPRSLVQHLTLDRRSPSETELWRCLTCGLCRERCPSDVDFPRFISRLRAAAFQDGKLPQTTHAGALQEIMRIQAHQGLEQKKMDWLPEWVNALPASVLDGSAEDVYFVGCAPYFDVVFGDFDLDLKGTHEAALELLKATGLNPAVLKDERCCGHDALWSGDVGLFRGLAERNLEMFEAAGLKRLFVSCPEGYHTFAHEYPAHFGKLGFEVINTVRYLAENPPAGFGLESVAATGALAGAARRAVRAVAESPERECAEPEWSDSDWAETDLPEPARPGAEFSEGERPEPCEVTYHDSCRMGRFSGLYDEPRRMLAMTNGIRLKEMEFNREQAPCCGSNLWINCDALSKKMQLELLEEARKTGAGIMLTACDKCRIHLACSMLQSGHVSNGLKTENILRFLYRKGVRKS